MLKKIIAGEIILAVILMVFLTGCYKVTTLTLKNDQAVSGPVSFKNDLLPVFNANCALSGCHTSGGLKPDLSADKAYTSILGGNYVNTGDPQGSELYLWLT
jgi:hypothetical protein